MTPRGHDHHVDWGHVRDRMSRRTSIVPHFTVALHVLKLYNFDIGQCKEGHFQRALLSCLSSKFRLNHIERSRLP